ncbi:hypothetical protein EDF57_11549 [Novosphingobium sp. PhB55]|uniref:hypothetical protein n=1 Tax=Novosphingobium sp. PhB55 TaxID=2485106 RepID=UPI001066CEA3|nr:hypothetical protein [Novosphingobium sp. PhB55]TDW59210.1 hypothetical protein EDF57_11549 [Novosphingobium sp. PhB55]
MARADRLERMDNRRADLETDYRAALIEALQATAAGQWGLFGHTKDKQHKAKAAPMLDALGEMAEEIDDLRDQLDMEPFALHRELLAARGPVQSDAVGEPKQAQAWLERLTRGG